MKSRTEWSDLFIKWIVAPHKLDKMKHIKGDSSEEEEEGVSKTEEQQENLEVSSDANSEAS